MCLCASACSVCLVCVPAPPGVFLPDSTGYAESLSFVKAAAFRVKVLLQAKMEANSGPGVD